ncbi:MAG TPA: hypothetical protein PK014_12240 [Thermoanaerobaculia bacterium]|nr:hypothetical protein [Thermoanaerobaculia bacterium]HUM30850.1 hypothetical protein [Thermoanaerobaculia bacterium]HXK69169.1 hypothetical protein [Thermoanaerobaculia bacterium]
MFPEWTGLQIQLRAAKNRFRLSPRDSAVRTILGVAFLLSILAGVLWTGGKLAEMLNRFELVSPRMAYNVLGQVTYRLLLPLFPLLVLSHSISSLNILFGDRHLNFYHVHPIGRFHLLRLTGFTIFFTTSGYILIIALPVFYKVGGVSYLVSSGYALLVFLLSAWGLGIFLTLLLASFFRVATLNRLFGVALAVSGALFVLSFRSLRPEMIFTSPQALLGILGGQMETGPTPAGWFARAVAGSRFGIPFSDALRYLEITALASIIAALVAHGWLYERAWERAQQVSDRVKHRPSRIATHPPVLAHMVREWLSLIRNPMRFSQVALMLALLVLYFYNLYLLTPMIDPASIHLVMALHTALTGFIIAALGVRFAFPAPSLDGEARWLLDVHPLSRWTHELGRSLTYGTLFSILSLTLTIGVAVLLHPPFTLTITILGIVFLLAWILALTAVFLGALKPRYDCDNPLQIGFSPEGLGYFLFGLIVTALTAYGVWRVFS